MKCPVCGSARLAWSDELGYVVCQDCGAVISELIDDEGPPGFSDAPVRLRRAGPQEAPPPVREPLEVAVEEAARLAVRRGRVIEVVGGTVRVRPPVVRRPEGIEGLLELMDGFPELKSRTERVRAAIAVYAALRSVGVSKSRAIELASRASGASPRSLVKVMERHRRSMAGYEAAVGRLARKGLMPLLASVLKA
ncbi:MAG: TFIIB-type zinc ribbon-containing protein [Acidilobus sp.]